MSNNKENIPYLPDLPECKCPRCKFHRAPKLTVEEHAQKVLRIKKMLSWTLDDDSASKENLLPAATTLKLTPDFRLNLDENNLNLLSNFRTPEPTASANVGRAVKRFALPNFRLNFDDVVDAVESKGDKKVDGVERDDDDDDDDRKPAAVITFNKPDNIHSMMSPIGSSILDRSVVTQPPTVNILTAEVKIKIEQEEETDSPPTSATGFRMNVAVSVSATETTGNKKRKTLKQQTITNAWRPTVAQMEPAAEEVVLTNVVYQDEHWIPRRVTSSGTFARVVPSSTPALFACVSSSPALQPMDDWRLAQILHQIELSELHKSNFPK